MDLFAEIDWGPICLSAAILIFIATLLVRLWRYMVRQKRSAQIIVRTDRADAARRGHHLGAPAEALRWEVGMEETARDLSAQLDSKMSLLQHLTAEADRAAARLETALEAAKEPAEAAPHQSPLPDQTRHGESSATPVCSLSQREQIYTLCDYGFDVSEIARRLLIPVAEVKQILRRRQDQSRQT